MIARKTVLVLLGAVVLGACQSTGKPGMVALDWQCKIRELQVAPSFPPREDILVGDLVVQRPSDTEQQTTSEYCRGVGREDNLEWPKLVGVLMGATQAVENFYRSRPTFASTNQAGVNLTNGNITVSGYGVPEVSGDSVFSNFNLKRGRLVAFPDFMAVRVTGLDLAAIVPVLGSLADVGLGLDAVASASVSVPIAESYGLPAGAAAKRLLQSAVTENGCTKAFKLGQPKWENDGRRDSGSMEELPHDWNLLRLLAGKPARPSKTGAVNSLYLTVVTEVYMARAIDASITYTRSFAGELSRDRENQVPGTSASGTDGSATLTEPQGDAGSQAGGAARASTNTGAAAASAATSEEQARKRISAIQDTLARAALSRKSLGGVTFNVRSDSARNVAVTQIFSQPVVIGYRGIDLVVEGDEMGCLTISPGATAIQIQRTLGGDATKVEAVGGESRR